METTFLPFYATSNKGVGEANTISSGPDNGANNNMRALFWKAMSHSSSEQAVNNWLSRLPALVEELESVSAINIGGHGNEGFLTTGCGQTGAQDYRTNTMALWNRFYWAPFFQRLKPKNYSILSIYSCHSGAGIAGADFLFALAQETGHPCQGRTGFTYSNNQRLWFENNSVWQVATPTNRPNPINAPSPHLNNIDQLMLLEINGKMEDVDVKNISAIKLTSIGFIGVRSQKSINIDKKELPDISSLILGSLPFKIDGEPLAEITGLVELELTFGKSIETRVFEIYNDRIIIDKKSKQSYYVNPALINYINNQ